MNAIRTAFLITELLLLALLPLGFSEPEKDQSGTFRLEDYPYWLKNHTIHLVNYVAEAGTEVLIMSPITPAPIGIRWFSLNTGGILPQGYGHEFSLSTSSYLERFQKTYNTSWQNAFKYDQVLNRWLRILKIRLGYADVLRVFVETSRGGSATPARVQTFDVAITLMTYEQHECGFASIPQIPKKGNTLILNCSVVVNGRWNTSLVFRNFFDGTEILGAASECGRQPRIGSKICSTVEVVAQMNLFAYSCRLKFHSNARLAPDDPKFQNSKWTAEFNKKAVCHLPKVFLQSVPSHVKFSCNNAPCSETALVNDKVTCEAHGHPRPVFDLRIRNLPTGHENNSKNPDSEVDNKNRFMADTDEGDRVDVRSHMLAPSHHKVTVEKIKGFGDYWIRQKDVGRVEITCNASNIIGWQHNGMVLEVKSRDEADATTEVPHSDVVAAAADGSFQPLYGMNILCKSLTCKNDDYLRFGDEIACTYDNKKIKDKLLFVLKIDHFEKVVRNPCVYTLKMEDVGKKSIQCVGYTEFAIAEMEVNITVVCAFKYPEGDPHHVDEYDDAVDHVKTDGNASDVLVICNDTPCDKPGRNIYTGTYLGCRYRDNRVANLYLNSSVNGYIIEGGLSKNRDVFYKLKLKNYGTMLVKCWNGRGANASVLAAVNLTVHAWPCPTDDDDDDDDDDAVPARRSENARHVDFRNTEVTTVGRVPAEAEKSKHGSCIQGSFVLELFLVFIGMLLGQIQF